MWFALALLRVIIWMAHGMKMGSGVRLGIIGRFYAGGRVVVSGWESDGDRASRGARFI